MTIKKIKDEMLSYIDFYGGDLLEIGEIEKCKNKKQLYAIIERHRNHMEDMLSDANSHLDSLKQRTGLIYLP